MTQTSTITIKDPQAPATLPQVNYLTSLIKDRECPTVAERFEFAQKMGFLAKGAASKLIDEAIKAPKKTAPQVSIDDQVKAHDEALAAAAAIKQQLTELPAFGYYLIDGTTYYWDVTGKDLGPQLRKLVTVSIYGGGQKGSWKKIYNGIKAVKVTGTWTPYAGKGWSKVEKTAPVMVPGVFAEAVMAGAKPLTEHEAASLGKQFGFCIRCGATLTDPVSVAAGIGPVCKTYWA